MHRARDRPGRADQRRLRSDCQDRSTASRPGMSAPPIRDRISQNQDGRGEPPRIDMLVLHYTGMMTAAAALDRLCNPAARVSAHYVVEENGAIWRLVPERHRAFHAGRSCLAPSRPRRRRDLAPGATGYRPRPRQRHRGCRARRRFGGPCSHRLLRASGYRGRGCCGLPAAVSPRALGRSARCRNLTAPFRRAGRLRPRATALTWAAVASKRRDHILFLDPEYRGADTARPGQWT